MLPASYQLPAAGILLGLVTLVGTIMTFVFPVRTALVPSLVARRDLAVGVALNSAVQNATRVVGPRPHPRRSRGVHCAVACPAGQSCLTSPAHRVAAHGDR